MKLTKFVHACLLAEIDGQSVLFDPGRYSWDSGLVDVGALPHLDAVVITHEHADHFYPPFVEAIIKRFPEAVFITTPTVAERLRKMGAEHVFTESTGNIQVFSKKHHAPNDPLKEPPPENIAVHLADRLTVGGDRHDLEETKEILALTITAPWGSERAAAQMTIHLKPKYVFPIHDWHWSATARAQEYDRFEKFCHEHAITFLKPKDGQPVEL